MVRRADAPPPGWYPDPTGRPGLLWWDGLDWSHHHRPPPPSRPGHGSGAEGAAAPDAAGADGRSDGPVATAQQLRNRGGGPRAAERQVVDAVAEARRVARSEVDRAVSEARRQLDETRDRFVPRLAEYRQRLRRWARIVAVVVVLLVALSAWSSATLQVGLLEWLGERIDAATATVVAAGGRPTHAAGDDVGVRAHLR